MEPDKKLGRNASLFSMYKHNEVLLQINDQEVKPSVVDFDFEVVERINHVPTATITIYNVKVKTYLEVKIFCNQELSFYHVLAPNDWAEGSLNLLENGFSTTLYMNVIGYKLPPTINANEPIKYKLAGWNEDANYVSTGKYIFGKMDCGLARAQALIQRESGLAKAFYLTSINVLKN